MIPGGRLPLQNGVPGFCPCPLALGSGPVQLLMDFAFCFPRVASFDDSAVFQSLDFVLPVALVWGS